MLCKLFHSHLQQGFFVHCCSNWHQTVVETGPFFSESMLGCLCCCKVLQSFKRAMLLSLKFLCNLCNILVYRPSLTKHSALDWSLWYQGSADSMRITVCISVGIFLVLFCLDNRILMFLGQSGNKLNAFQRNTVTDETFIYKHFFKGLCGTLPCVSQHLRVLSLYTCALSLLRDQEDLLICSHTLKYIQKCKHLSGPTSINGYHWARSACVWVVHRPDL